MKLFVIGATGRTGQEIVQQALDRGHHVTAFVRSPESIALKNERLSVLKGNAMDESQLFEAMQNHDAVISTLGPREVFKPSSLLNDSAIATSRAMQRSGVKRLVVLSAAQLKEFAPLVVARQRQARAARQPWLAVDEAHERLRRAERDAEPVVVGRPLAERDRVGEAAIRRERERDDAAMR